MTNISRPLHHPTHPPPQQPTHLPQYLLSRSAFAAQLLCKNSQKISVLVYLLYNVRLRLGNQVRNQQILVP